MELIEKIKASNLINLNDRIVVGVSGGPDSICLLSVLVKLKKEFNLALFVVHINHSLRDEADFEENYVKEMSKKFDLEFFSKKVDVKVLSAIEKKSTEEVARDVRYNFFYEVAEKVGANKIAVAHNLNDSVETILMNLIRGCGIDGLCGIQRENGKIIRPLLEISRDEIEKYVEENKLTAMRDKTNLETVYTRNKIRNELIPYLKKLNPEVVESIHRTSILVNSTKEICRSVVDKTYKDVRLIGAEVVLDKNEFLKLSLELKREVLRKAVYDFSGNLVDIGMSTIDNAINIINTSRNGSTANILKDINIKISYDKLIFFSRKDDISFLYELVIPGITYIPEIDKKIITTISSVENVPNRYEDRNKCFFDIDKIGKKLYVRSKKDGDYFEPSGMNGKKTLKKFFSDLKIDVNERKKIPIIANDEEIVWVAGFRTSRNFLKDKDTKEVIIFEYGEDI